MARSETDAPDLLNVYGKSKLAGDRATQSSQCDHLIFRSSWVYGARGGNLLLTMLRLAQERGELSIADDQVGAPTSNECIAQAPACVLAQILAPSEDGILQRSGVYNLTSGGEASWYELVGSIFAKANARFNLAGPRLTPTDTAAFSRPARRPANSRLCGRRLEEVFGVKLPHWDTALDLVLDTMAETARPIKTEV
jgi:dTDP-4-dehydrorhamnose reductase